MTKSIRTGKPKETAMKALALLSGGLDSSLAVKLVKDQGIDVVGVTFTSPFCLCGKGGCGAVGMAKQLEIPLKIIRVGEDYLEVLKNPKFGYGRNMNPCKDCRIYMLKKAEDYREKVGASFLFTGEVVGQRPMSQTLNALKVIEKEAGMEGKILRPLSAKLLPATEAEEKGWVDREKLLDIHGRSRKKQMELAEKSNLKDYPCPAGGCLLTYKEFAAKVRDLIQHGEDLDLRNINLLKVGRHFRLDKNKIIVGRNEKENEQLQSLRKDGELCFEVPDCGSPITLLQGPANKKTIETAAALTLCYSDSEDKKGKVLFGSLKLDKSAIVSSMNIEEAGRLRVR